METSTVGWATSSWNGGRLTGGSWEWIEIRIERLREKNGKYLRREIGLDHEKWRPSFCWLSLLFSNFGKPETTSLEIERTISAMVIHSSDIDCPFDIKDVNIVISQYQTSDSFISENRLTIPERDSFFPVSRHRIFAFSRPLCFHFSARLSKSLLMREN